MELGDSDRVWLTEQGISLDDPRITVVEAEDGALGFDVAGRLGPAKVRFDAKAITLKDAAWTSDGKVAFPAEGSIGPDNWKPWYIPSGPAAVKGTRYDEAGVAVRAALRGETWPAGWPPEYEERM